MAYTSDKKPGGLTQVTSLGDNDNVVVDQSGSVKRATLDQLESKIFDSKTGISPVSGTEVVVVRKTDNSLGQVALSNIVAAGNITNAKVAAINSPSYLGITDDKLATINTAGKVTNQAVQAVATNTANRIVTRDGSGNFAAGTITATLSGNASTATTAAAATALATGRTLAMTGDVTYTSPSFNGTANVTAAATLANSGVVAGTYNNNDGQVRPFTVDAKGRVTAIGTAVDIALPYAKIFNTPYKYAITAATTSNLTATYNNGTAGVGATLTNSGSIGQLTVDGVDTAVGFRILVKNQSNANHNGIYTVTNNGTGGVAWVLTRATDVDTDTNTRGAVATVQRGGQFGGKLFATDFKTFSDPGTVAQNWYQVVTTGDSETVSTAMIAANAVDNTKMRDSAALSVIGRSANSTGGPADIAAGTDGHVLRRSGTTLAFGQVATAGIADANVTTAKLATAVQESLVPPGAVMAFARNTAPDGWLKANGAAVSRVGANTNLFAAIGTTFGAGNGSTTFNLPNLRGEFIRGWSDGISSVDPARVFGSNQSDELKSHKHTVNKSGTGGGAGAQTGPPSGGTLNTSSIGGNETRPRNVALLYCIKL